MICTADTTTRRFNIHANLAGVAPSVRYNGYGWRRPVRVHTKNWLGIVGDLAGYGATSTANGAVVGGAFTCLFGPRVNSRRGRVTPFAQAPFGGIRATDGIGESGPENNFAMTAGGGTDFKSVQAGLGSAPAGRVLHHQTASWSRRPKEQSADWHRGGRAPREIISRWRVEATLHGSLG